ncbi:MAG TPA: DJ-1/PfpI family protein [Acetobacteraceae bacterium]|nr:DJ-1/PfpI family protein [Acetobacteraceae bacterium]
MSGHGAAPDGVPMRIVIPVYDQVDMLDVCGPSEMFSWPTCPGPPETPKFKVDLVAEKPGEVMFNSGFIFKVSAGLDSVAPADALWVPGGDPDSLKRIIAEGDKSPYLRFLKRQAAQSKWICSVCEGALLLAAAGLLDGYLVTTHWAFIPYLMAYHPAVRVADGHPRFVIDRDRLTGGGISSGLDEALKLIELLAGRETAISVQQTTQYYPDPPVTSAIPHVIATPMLPPPPHAGAPR